MQAYKIKLGNEMFATINFCDLSRVSRHSWHLSSPSDSSGGKKFFAKSDVVIEKGTYSPTLLQNFILKPPKGYFVKFIDGDGLNCTRDNMVVIPLEGKGQGIARRTKSKTSEYVGVHKMSHRGAEGKWRAKIIYQGKYYHIGCFNNELEAAIAYNKKALELYGKDARLNPVPTRINEMEVQ